MNRIEKRALANTKLEALSLKKADLDQGQKSIDTTLYVIGEVTKGGTVKIFDKLTEQNRRAGLTNFDGNQLNRGSYAVLDGVCIEVATSTDQSIDGRGLDFSEEADAAIKAADFVFMSDTEIVTDMPVNEAHNPNTTRSNDEKFRELSHLPVIESQKLNEITFEFPQGMSPDTTDSKRHFVKISFRAFKTVTR